jgi:Flp pilus assembly protein TadG
MRSPKALARRQSGSAAVELAFLLPLLVFLVFVGVDFARIFYFATIVTNAARNGAVYGSSYPNNATDTSGIQQAALADATDLSPAPTVSSTTSTDSNGNNFVSVTVTWNFTTVINYPGVPSSITLSRTIQMQVAPLQPAGS